MPLETKETFFEGMRKLSHANIDRVIPFTSMMLKGTEFASSANRKNLNENELEYLINLRI